MEDEEVREGFIRQRRNLMLMSVVVFFTQYVGLKFETLSVFGNTANIDQPEKVYVFLWILLGYWLLRYTQYLHEIGFPHDWKDFLDKRDKILKVISFRRMDAEKHEALQSHLDKLVEETGGRSEELPWANPTPHVSEVSNIRISHLSVARGKAGLFSLEVSCQYSYEWDGGRRLFNGLYDAKGTDVLASNVRAAIYVMVAKRFFTEYLLPYLLFVIAVGSAVDYHF